MIEQNSRWLCSNDDRLLQAILIQRINIIIIIIHTIIIVIIIIDKDLLSGRLLS